MMQWNKTEISNRTRPCLLVLLLILLPLDGYAFGQAGHRIICEMAYRMLDDDTRRQVNQVIKAIPDNHRKALNKAQGRAQDTEITFASSCVWPDVVKKWSDYDTTGPWHYINVQREDREVELDDCMVGCLLSAIKDHRRVFRLESQAWPRAQALMFLGHWLADIHQPMHVSFGDDRGGNSVKVSVQKDATAETSQGGTFCGNLHLLWDVCLIDSTGLNEAELTDKLMAEISQLDREVWSGDPPKSWANESLAISTSKSVRYCSQEGGICKSIPADPDQPHQLPVDYLRTHWVILKERMQQASVRLVWLLNDIYSR
jgi:hypothetical protein